MKRKLAILAGLMAMGMVSFAVETEEKKLLDQSEFVELQDNESNAEVYETAEEKSTNSFDISDRYRFNQNRVEINGEFNLSESNRLEMRIRHDSAVGAGSNKISPLNTQDGDSTEVRLRLHTQTSIEDFEVRTELQTNSFEDDGNRQYIRVQPTWHFFTDIEGLTSLARAGVAMEHDGDTHGQDFSLSFSYENFYVLNDYMAFEGNVYYDWTFAGDGRNGGQKGGVGTYNLFSVEAYAYFNYPLYETKDYKFEVLLEAGMDPYGFGSRNIDDWGRVREESSYGEEFYVFYAEPSLKVSGDVWSETNIYAQLGYYVETNDTSTAHDDSMFGRIGVVTKF